MRRSIISAVLRGILIIAGAACASEPATDPFGPAVTSPVPAAARGFTVFSEAGPLQVAMVVEPASRVALAVAATGGRFANAETIGVGQGPRAIASRRLRDGRVEVVTGNATDRTLTRVGRGTDGALRATSVHGVSASPMGLVAADVDGDGEDDLAAVVGLSDADSALELWRSEDLAAGRPGVRIAVPGVSSSTLGDLDGDGDTDAMLVLETRNRVVVLENVEGALRERRALEVCEAPAAAHLAPARGADAPRAAVACRSGGLDVIRDPAGDGTPSREHLGYGGELSDVVAADWNVDGSMDLAGVDPFGHRVVIWFGRPDGTWAGPYEHPAGLGPVALVSVDVDDDGDFDLLVLAFATRTLEVLPNATDPRR